MANFLLNKRKIIVILLIFTVGIFLRMYNFSDWLHFELDQSRDAKIVDLAIEEGAGNLPLLGPKAAGSFLRLGPVFYYFSYLSALIFGNNPAGIAVIIMLFGIAAIPVFYLFIRRYFEENTSLALAGLFSVSIFLVMYSRFSWNPNALPFFIILSLYALLRACGRDEKRKGWWFLLFSFTLAIATQLHFLALVTLPVATTLFLAIKRPKIKIAYWVGALAILAFLYLPVFINEIKTGGENFKQFSKVTSKKSTQDNHTLMEKIIRNVSENSLGHYLILSGQMDGELPKVRQGKDLKFKITCDQFCRDKAPLGVLALLIFVSGTLLLIKNVLTAKSGSERDFLILCLVYFATLFVVFIPIAYNLSPRFFLLASFIPFIFLGLILKFISKFVRKKSFILVMITISFFVFSNLWEINKRFGELKKAPREPFKISGDRILKERTRVTLAQQYLVVDFIESFYQKNKYPVYLNSEPYFRRAFLYHLEKRKITADDFRNSVNNRQIFERGNYFLIYPTLSDANSEFRKYLENYNIVDKKEIGTLTVFRLIPKKEAINAYEQKFGLKKKPVSASGVPIRCRWNEIFKKCNPDEVIGEENAE